MAYYIEITEEELLKLAEGVEILGRLRHNNMEEPLSLWIYGTTSDPAILDAAKEAIAENSDEGVTEDTIQLTEVAVGIAVDMDGKTLYQLSGSGITLDKGDIFAYQGGEGEGIRDVSFQWSHYRANVNYGKLKNLCLATEDSWLDRYLQQFGNKMPAVVHQQVQREAPATENAAPAGAAVPPAPQQKQTSTKGPRLSRVLEDWLG